MPNDLKPCPFCGATPYIFVTNHRHDEKSYMIKCSNIECSIIPYTYDFSELEYAINAWNRRSNNG